MKWLKLAQIALFGRKTSLISMFIALAVIWNTYVTQGVFVDRNVLEVFAALGLWNAGAAKIDRISDNLKQGSHR